MNNKNQLLSQLASKPIHRIPNIVPMRRAPATTSKTESRIGMGKPQNMGQDYFRKFETEEEVQTEEECGRVEQGQWGRMEQSWSLKQREGLNRRMYKNPYQQNSVKRKVGNGGVSGEQYVSSTSVTHHTRYSGKASKVLSVYHCDSLCIRPNQIVAAIGDGLSNKEGEQQVNKDGRDDNNKDGWEQQSKGKYREQEQNLIREKVRQSIFAPAFIGPDKKKKGIFKSRVQGQLKNRVQGQLKSKSRIEESKWSQQQLPFALRQPLLAGRQHDDMHIIFETDQITQCCT